MFRNILRIFCSRRCYQRAWTRERPGYSTAATRRHLLQPEKRAARDAYMAEYRNQAGNKVTIP